MLAVCKPIEQGANSPLKPSHKVNRAKKIECQSLPDGTKYAQVVNARVRRGGGCGWCEGRFALTSRSILSGAIKLKASPSKNI